MKHIEIITIREGLAAGKTYEEIAEELGVCERSVRRRYSSRAWTVQERAAHRAAKGERKRHRSLAARPAPVAEGLWVATRWGWRVTLLDPEDREMFAHIPLFGSTDYQYASFREGRRSEYLHRRLLGLAPGQRDQQGKILQVDHRNRDALDNRRFNIWICTPKENAANRGGIFAVAAAA